MFVGVHGEYLRQPWRADAPLMNPEAGGPVTQALLVIVGAIGATIATATAPAVGALVGIGTLRERRLKRQASALSPLISEDLRRDGEFDAWVKARAAHALKSEMAALLSLIQSTAEAVKAHGEQIAAVSKTSTATAADVAYIRGRMEATR